MGKPLISVVLPTYNRVELLSRAIDSVLTQADEKLELIIINDGSTDNTAALIEGFKDERIRYIPFVQNKGIGQARNAGVAAARGELIAFVDSDDVWLPNKLIYQMDVMSTYPEIELLFGDFHNLNRVDGSEDLGFKQTKAGLDLLQTRPLEADLYLVENGLAEALLIRNFFATPTVMFRKTIIEKVGNYNVKLSGPEDFEFWWRSAVMGIRFAYTTRPLIVRYKDEGSITAQKIRFGLKYLQALEFCANTAKVNHRQDLLPKLGRAKGQIWLNIARSYALEGNRREALQAYYHSLQFGISNPGLPYIAIAIMGKRGIAWLKAIRKKKGKPY